MKPRTFVPVANVEPTTSNTAAASLGGELSSKMTGSEDVAGKIAPETNPFTAADANPYKNVYKNPFTK